jgi:hypothetical protein
MLSAMVILPHTFFFTADAESMYTNIDTNSALAYISSYIRDHAAEFEFYSVEALVEALKIVMKNIIFTFGDTYWRQDSGTVMGTPPAPHWANIFYALFENQFVPQFVPNLIFYKRFIDDIIGLWTITDSAMNTASWESYIQAMNSEDYGLTWIVSPSPTRSTSWTSPFASMVPPSPPPSTRNRPTFIYTPPPPLMSPTGTSPRHGV